MNSDELKKNLGAIFELAKKGDKDAQCLIANLYYRGMYLPQDYQEAIKWYLLAANQGSELAQGILGDCYADGIGVTKDINEAVRWWLESSKNGNFDSIKAIVGAYKEGIISEELFLSVLPTLKALIDKNGYGEEKPLNSKLAKYLEDANKGDAEAQFMAGTSYYEGKIVEKDYKQSIYWLTKAAIQGHKDAQFNLAGMYYEGRGVAKDYEKAYKLYHNLALKGDADCMYMLGFFSYHGLYVEKDLFDSVRWYQKAANMGNEQALLSLKAIYEQGFVTEELNEEKIQELLMKAQDGDHLSLLRVAFMSILGKGLMYNKKLAMEIFEKLALENDPIAIYNLGICYSRDEYMNIEKARYWLNKGVELDDVLCKEALSLLEGKDDFKENKGIEYIKEMASHGEPKFCSMLAYYYSTGEGVPYDMNKAIELWTYAANKGVDEAQYNLGVNYFKGKGVIKDNKEAFKWWMKAANQGHMNSKLFLGYCYYQGFGCTKNVDLAIPLIKEAAEAGIAGAEHLLGYIYGETGKDNEDEAIKWLTKSAKLGVSESQYMLGNYYFEGKGVDMDKSTAIYWWDKACKLGHSDALFSIARCYEKGIVLEKDVPKAYEYYEKAYQNGCEYAKEDVIRTKLIITKDYLHLSDRSDTFIVYSKEDKHTLDELISYLEENDIMTVYEPKGEGIGKLNKLAVEAMEESKTFVVLLSGNALRSEIVKNELMVISNIVNECKEKNYTIIPLVINNYLDENGKLQSIDVYKEINSMDESSPFKQFLNLCSQFAKNNYLSIDKQSETSISEVYASLLRALNQAIDISMKIKYREKIKTSFAKFNTILTNTVKNQESTISTTFDFNNGYIDRPLYGTNGEIVNAQDLLDKSFSLIYGEGGSGKTLFLKNIISKEFKDTNYVFYLPCKQFVHGLVNLTNEERKNAFINILKKEAFDNFFKNEKTISLSSFSNIFNSNNKIIILIDALDEIEEKYRSVLYSLVNDFVLSYHNTNLSIIFTSRNKQDAYNLPFGNINIYELKGLNDNEIHHMYDNIMAKCSSKAQKEGQTTRSNFFKGLEKVNNDIKQNPFLLANLIYVYIFNNKIPNKQFDIIQKANELLVVTIDKQRDFTFKYYDCVSGYNLNKLLGYIAFMKANNETIDVEYIVNDYLENFKILDSNEDLNVASYEICDFLRRRSIIVDENIAHEIFKDYYAAIYLFSRYFMKINNENTSYIDYIDGKKDKFNILLSRKLSNKDTPWPSIASNLITKLDFEIYLCEKNPSLDESSLCYPVFNDVLEKVTNDNGYSKEAIATIKGLCEKELLYYYDFIKSYLK